jgi:hypothetical protein
MTLTVATVLLFLNSFWDLVSVIAICARMQLGRCYNIADAHLGLWVDQDDSEGFAAAAIMAVLLAQWSLLRMQGALSGPHSDAACFDASTTYVLEAVLVAFGVVAGRMHRLSGWFVVTTCVVCWALVVRECLEGV